MDVVVTTIGALAGTATALFKTVEAARPLLGRNAAQQKLVADARGRLAGIAIQLERGLTLSKLLNEWLIMESEFDAFDQKLSITEIKRLDSELRRLINMSVRDQFSGAFFRTRFDSLPGIEHHMTDFRENMKGLDTHLSSIPPNDHEAWKQAWPLLRFRLHEARISACQIRDCAEEHLAKIIDEIAEAARG